MRDIFANGKRGLCMVSENSTRREAMMTRIAEHPINRIVELLPWNLAANVPPTNAIPA